MATDPTSVVVAGVSLMVIVFGLIEFLKAVGHFDGTEVTIMSFGVGFLLMAIYLVGSYLPDPYNLLVNGFFACLVVGLAASGYYKFLSQRFPKTG